MYPTIEQYKDAIRIAEHSLATLNDYEAVLKADGDPWFSSGNFAVVFQLRHKQDGKRLALKCFTRHQERRGESYRLISQQLATIQSDYILQYQYLENEIWVNDHSGEGAEYPVVAMEWAEGVTLGDYIKQQCTAQNKVALQALANNFEVLCAWLIAQPFAHGDLKPDNIMVRPNGTLALVDYDGMYVPNMQGQQAREFGSPIYRHPKRTLDTYDRHVDDFSLLVLLSELRLVAADPTLYNGSLSGESIVAKASDWQHLNDAHLLRLMQAQATQGGDLSWVTWAAMLRITVLADTYKVVDWTMMIDTTIKPIANIGKPSTIPPPTDKVFRNAIEAISENMKTKNPYLDLGCCDIQGELPDLLFDCVWLETLIVSNEWKDGNGNKLTSQNNGKANCINHISPKINALSRLKVLRLGGEWANRWQISDLAFIKNLVHLEELTLSYNQLTDISALAGLGNLKKLHLGNNKITDIFAIARLGQLKQLYLGYNKITDIFALKLPNLEELNLSYNELTDIFTLTRLEQLKKLYLGRNNIKDISALAKLYNLEVLGLKENQITDISALAGLGKLKKLDLGRNNAKDFYTLAKLTNLEALWLEENQVMDISALAGLEKLKILDLSRNNIKDISALAKLYNLEVLNLGYNHLTSISALSDLGKLKIFDLLWNKKITDISALAKLSKLKKLYLINNNIKDISALAKLYNLEILDLMWNKITDISALAGLGQLKKLDLRGNNITNMHALSGLKDLKISW